MAIWLSSKFFFKLIPRKILHVRNLCRLLRTSIRNITWICIPWAWVRLINSCKDIPTLPPRPFSGSVFASFFPPLPSLAESSPPPHGSLSFASASPVVDSVHVFLIQRLQYILDLWWLKINNIGTLSAYKWMIVLNKKL